MNFNSSQVEFNLKALSAFGVGDKPITDWDKMEISVDKRALFVWVRRGYEKAFDPGFIEKLYQQALDNLEFSANYQENLPHSESMKAIKEKISDLLPQSFVGLQSLETTYRNDAKYVTADAIGKIAMYAKERFQRVSQVQKTPVIEKIEVQESTLLIVEDKPPVCNVICDDLDLKVTKPEPELIGKPVVIDPAPVEIYMKRNLQEPSTKEEVDETPWYLKFFSSCFPNLKKKDIDYNTFFKEKLD